MLRRSVAYRIQNPKEAHDAHLQTTEVGLKQTARGISVARAGRGEARDGPEEQDARCGVHGAPRCEGAAIWQQDDHRGSLRVEADTLERKRRTVVNSAHPQVTLPHCTCFAGKRPFPAGDGSGAFWSIRAAT